MANFIPKYVPSFVPVTGIRLLLVQEMYRKHRPHLLAYATRRLDDEDAAEDVVQCVFEWFFDGNAPVPAVNVVRKLEQLTRESCSAHLKAERAGRVRADALRDREMAAKAAWRTWMRALKSRGDRNDDLEEGDQ
jgi:DNA-directed RNA polymerase specialized sigma24 family protein